MGQLVMSFLGICMNVSDEAGLPDGVGHRVVLVDVLQEVPTVKFGTLPPHACFLEFLSPSLADMMLVGWNITVANATGPLRVNLEIPEPSTDPQQLTEVPHLTTYDPNMQIRPDLLDPGPPMFAACYVDINNGTVSAGRFDEGGVYTTWTVETDGDPELVLTPRNGGPLRLIVPSTPVGARFPPPRDAPGSLLLRNAALNADDKQFDFVLHYVAAEGGIPQTFAVAVPQDTSDRARQQAEGRTMFFGTTTSCSNSQYP